MSSLFTLSTPLTEALGWSVVHSLWQATLLALLLRLIINASPHWSASRHYRLAYGTLVLQGLCFLITVWYYYPTHFDLLATTDTLQGFVADELTVTITGESTGYWASNWQAIISSYLPLVSWCWLAGLTFFLLRLAGGWWSWHQLRKHGLEAVPESWQVTFDSIRKRLGVSRLVNFRLSAQVSSPLLLGQLKPLILVPVALVNSLSIAELEMILAHELAHLKRYDFVFNIIQLILESLLYFHPAVWWTGNTIRHLREACCDDYAIQETGQSLHYARTLLHLAERLKTKGPSNFQMAFLGSKHTPLLYRVQRILKQPTKQPDMREKFAVTALLLVLAVAVSLNAAKHDPQEAFFDETPPTILVDTLPQGNLRIVSVEDNGESIEFEIKEGNIEFLKVNGEVIPPERYNEYEGMVTQQLENIPPPPPPPPPPPAPGVPPPPPPPPAPPAPGNGGVHIEIHKDGHRTVIIEDKDMNHLDDVDLEEVEHIEVIKEKGGDRSTVIITKKDGDRAILKLDSDDDIIMLDDELRHMALENEKIIIDLDEDMARVHEEMEHVQAELAREMAKEAEQLVIYERELRELAREQERATTEAEREELAVRREAMRESMRPHRDAMRAHKRVLREELRREMSDLEIELDDMSVIIDDLELSIEEIDIPDIEMISPPTDEWLPAYLQEEGHIEDMENYSIKLNANRIKVNGKRLPDSVHREIMETYEAVNGKPFSKNSSIETVKRSN